MKDADISLIQSAAKAAGIKLQLALGLSEGDSGLFTEDGKPWNPLTDDGDALRLAVDLRMGVQSNGPDHFQTPNCTIVLYETVCPYRLSEPHGNDPHAATRRAIVRAAAEIGKAMK